MCRGVDLGPQFAVACGGVKTTNFVINFGKPSYLRNCLGKFLNSPLPVMFSEFPMQNQFTHYTTLFRGVILNLV